VLLDEQKGHFGPAWVRLEFATFVTLAGVMLVIKLVSGPFPSIALAGVTNVEIPNAPTLAQNAPIAQLGAPRACQSTCTSFHMAKTRHSGRMFGRKTARERSPNDLKS
jgi:hypothetical protein